MEKKSQTSSEPIPYINIGTYASNSNANESEAVVPKDLDGWRKASNILLIKKFNIQTEIIKIYSGGITTLVMTTNHIIQNQTQ